MNKKQLMAFVQWLPTKVKELQNKSPEEIVGVLNELSKTPEGQQQIEGLVNQFKQESAGMFKRGGKLNSFVERFQTGGKKSTPKINPNDANAISKSLNNRAGDRSASDAYYTAGMVADSLKKVGYNPALVDRLANPVYRAIEERINKEGARMHEDSTPRQMALEEFIRPVSYWKKGSETEPVRRDTTSVNREVIPDIPGEYKDREVSIVDTFPHGHQRIRTISRHINAIKPDTLYWERIQNLLPNGNPESAPIVNQIIPDSILKNLLK